MTITVPDGLKLTEEEALIDMAVGMVAAGKISSGRAAVMCGMDREDFRGILKERKIETYTVECLEQDMRVVDELRDREARQP